VRVSYDLCTKSSKPEAVHTSVGHPFILRISVFAETDIQQAHIYLLGRKKRLSFEFETRYLSPV
jgi:hypothetical protein